jgi:hypothetical protein
MPKKVKRPRDINQLAYQVVQLATGQIAEDKPEETPEQRFRREFARSGGLKGGKARAKALTKAERVAIAKKAAKARWKKK